MSALASVIRSIVRGEALFRARQAGLMWEPASGDAKIKRIAGER